jgi:phage shock protein PspC (stress-responsive transcriptional regulator)
MDTEQLAPDAAIRSQGRPHRWAVRRREDRLVAGLATGLGDRWGIPVAYLRAALVVATFAGGAGIAAYLIGWAFTLERSEDAPEPEPISPTQKTGLALIYAGALLGLRASGLWLGDRVTFSAALLAFGIAAMWDRSDPAARSRIARLTGSGQDEVTRIRVIAGGLLMLAGLHDRVRPARVEDGRRPDKRAARPHTLGRARRDGCPPPRFRPADAGADTAHR